LYAFPSHSAFLKQVAVSRALKGIGLAVVAQAIQSLVADSTDESNRGAAFGWLHDGDTEPEILFTHAYDHR